MHVSRARMARAAVLVAIGLLVLASSAQAAAGSVSQLTLDAYSPTTKPDTPPAATNHRLASHKLYVATVQGTVSFYGAIDYVAIQSPFNLMCGAPQAAPMFSSAGGAGEVGNDAEFVFAQPVKGTSCAHTKLPRRWPNFQVNSGTGWRHPALLSPRAPTRPDSTHTYEYALAGDNRSVRFRLLDVDVRDDYGSLLITVRAAVKGDCAGQMYRAFGLGSRATCLKAAAGSHGAPHTPAPPAPLTLDQSPIARVLRDSDVPGAINLEVPSGALTASPFATIDNSSQSQAMDELNVLNANGYASGAISELTGTHAPLLRSSVAELGSQAQALAAEQAEVKLAMSDQAPAGTITTSGPDNALGNAFIVTFTPAAGGGKGGRELFAVQGNYLYALKAVEQPDYVSRTAEDQLLGALIARG